MMPRARQRDPGTRARRLHRGGHLRAPHSFVRSTQTVLDFSSIWLVKKGGKLARQCTGVFNMIDECKHGVFLIYYLVS